MWRFEQPPRYRLADTQSFLTELESRRGFFSPSAAIAVARAPGRLDLMGGIADYSGSLVLELPLAAGTYVAAQPALVPTVTVMTTAGAGLDGEPRVELPLEALMPASGTLSYSEAHCLLAEAAESRWAAYVLGGLVVLRREYGVEFDHGLRLLVYSEVPLGKGVGSSAALEVAALCALADIAGPTLSGREIALASQMVENLIVGAPCGVMDQMTAAAGQQDRLLALLCQPAELQPAVPLSPNVEVWGIDSGVRHAISGADYRSVRIGAFMGYRIIAQLTGLPWRLQEDGRVEIEGGQFRGYLANVTPSAWEERFRDHVPETMAGDEFLERYGGLTDDVTRVDPARPYAVRVPTAHPIYEHDRVRRFGDILQAGLPDEEQLGRLGQLMFESHVSYSACGLGSDATDCLVELIRTAGPSHGLHGAKITGGGSGGTVAVLAERHSYSEIRRIAELYEQESGRRATILGGSSPGAVPFGVWRLIAD